jgi:capsular polysaccharide transport system permease protein
MNEWNLLDSNPAPILLQHAQPPRLKRLLKRLDIKFVVTVLLPTLVAVLYYGFIASDVYISESRFVVRNPQRATQTGLGALLQGTGFSRSQDDTYSVHDYILSRDALHELDQKLHFRQAYSSPAIDVFDRFHGLDHWDASFESLYKYYLRHVDVEYDTVSSITVLTVRGFTAEDAKKINEQLLEMGERLVNNMNMRGRQDLIQVAENEVALAEGRSKAAASALSLFRSDRSVFDPDRQSALQLQGVSRLRDELLAAQSQLEQVRKVSPANPQIGSLETRVAGLRNDIAEENARVMGRDGGLSSKSPVFDRLTLEKTFADRQLGVALATLDSARSEAIRKQLYLERLVEPNLPDKALEPRRLRSVLMVLVVGLAMWAVVSLVAASIREHAD